jgi:hypothetical protein
MAMEKSVSSDFIRSTASRSQSACGRPVSVSILWFYGPDPRQKELFIFSSLARPSSSQRMKGDRARSVGARNGALGFPLEQLYSERKGSVDALSTLSFSSCLG